MTEEKHTLSRSEKPQQPISPGEINPGARNGRTIAARKAGVGLLSIAALTLAACSSGDNADSADGPGIDVHPEGDYHPVDRDQLQDGGELRLPIGEIPEQQNALHANFTSDTVALWEWYNPQLYLLDDGGNLEYNPDYFTDVTHEEIDGKTVVTYELVDEATFNDGTPIDWRAFEATWKALNGENTEFQPAATDGYDSVESVVAGDSEKHAVVTYKSIYPWWEEPFTTLLHPDIDTPEEFNEGYLNQMRPEWGAGPFTVASTDFQAGNVVFEANDKWWGDEPKLDRVTLRQLESQAVVNAFRSGEIDAADVSDKNSLAVVQQMGNDVDIRASLTPYQRMFSLNSESPQLADLGVRHGILAGIDREQLAEIRFNGLGYEEEMPGSMVFMTIQDEYQDNVSEVVEYDPENAKQLLESAGYEMDGEFYSKDGERLSLRYVLIGDDDVSKATARALQAMMREIGVELRIEERPSSEFANVLEERDFDVFLSGVGVTGPDSGVVYFSYFFSTDSNLDLSRTGTEEMDAKIEEMRQLDTADEQRMRANELEKEAFAQYGRLPYANGPQMTAVKSGLANYGPRVFTVLEKQNIGWEK
ncbi:ABC transporter family substrate-binding protein [Corynebacterium pseudodiphtheriticum]|uniref:ABC transporter family substrate-binding protein n=1 Tax=Corynebacterium pseudodiphtheriticum TaxID=37637 RepID=UPI0020BDD81E|nr:ABC transporter family substrate-binding protein [Corynebacterium pseudodiphtheriticum]UQV58746.1 ABC transporter family substrate-binding protein [Corynebacterium pseudodiphtheriticum]